MNPNNFQEPPRDLLDYTDQMQEQTYQFVKRSPWHALMALIFWIFILLIFLKIGGSFMAMLKEYLANC